MKKCPGCSRIYDDSQSFCLDDGTALIAESTIQAAETVVIPPAETLVVPRKRSKLPFIFVGILVLLVVGLIVAWLILQRNYGERDPQRAAGNVQSTPIPIQPANNTVTTIPSPSPSPTDLPQTNANLPANSDTVSTSKPVDVNDPTKSAPIMKTEDHSVLFNLHQCRKSGSSITCDFTFTNKGPDRKFQFVVYRSNLFDELGNTYDGKNGQIASNAGSSPEIVFVSGVTAKAQITFEGVQPNATKITLLRIQYDVGDDYRLEVKFRNVPLLMPK